MHQAVLLCALLLPGDDRWFYGRLTEYQSRLNDDQVRPAMKVLDAVEKEAEGESEIDWVLWARLQRGLCQARLGDYPAAQKTLEGAVERAPQDHPLLFDVYYRLGEIRLRTVQPGPAESALKAALDRADKPIRFRNEKPQAIPETDRTRIRLLIGECSLAGGDNAKARERIAEVEKEIDRQMALRPGQREDERAAWPSLLVQCEAQLAELDKRDADAFGAIRCEEKSLDALKGVNTPDGPGLEFSCRLGLAGLYRNIVRYREADEQLDAAEKLLAALPTDQYRGDLANHRAALRIEWAAALVESEAAARGLPDRLDRAEEAARAAADAYQKAHPEPSAFRAAALSSLAQVHELRGRLWERDGKAKECLREYVLARDFADESLRQFDAASFPPSHDLVLEGRRLHARLLLKLGDPDAARAEAADALQRYIKNHGGGDTDPGCGPYHQLLAEIEDRAGLPAAAAVHAEAHRQLSAERLVNYLPRLTAPEQVQFFRNWDDPGLHAALRLGIHHDSLRAESAEWLINGKAKAAEVLADVNLHERGRKDYQEFQRAVAEQAYLLFGPPADPAALGRELLEVESRKRELAAKQEPQAPEKPHRLSDLQNALAEDEAYIDIYCLRPEEAAPRAYFAWVVAARGDPAVVKLGDADRIDELVKTFQDHMVLCGTEDRTKNLITTMGHTKAVQKLKDECLKDLSAALLDPVLPMAAGKKRWIVSPDGPLWNVPWAALILPKTDKYVVEDYTVRYVISGRDLLRPPNDRQPGDPWIVADPDLTPAGAGGKSRLNPRPQLKGAREEGTLVAERLKPFFKGEPHVLTGAEATKQTFLDLDKGPPPRVLYLATHGFGALPGLASGDDGPRIDPLLGCGVAFAGYNLLPDAPTGLGRLETTPQLPGLLTGAEVLAVDLRGTDLVVLSACDSGVGVTLTGQSPADLRHAFHLAGARAVASSLWSADDRATQDLMGSFMTAYAAGRAVDKAEALADAQRQMLRSPRLRTYSHPYFWAAFTLSGL